MTGPTQSAGPHAAPGILALVAAMLSQNAGAAFAKQLFPLIGATGVTSLRIGLAACLLMLLRRPWRHGFPRASLRGLLLYGTALGCMNFSIYQAFARLPLGIAVAVEVTGPLTIALLGSRRRLDLLWLGLAVIGLLLLLPLRHAAPVDPVGIAFAMGAAMCWALYIVFGKRVSAGPDAAKDAATWGMAVAAIIAVPVGVADVGAALLSPMLLLAGLGLAALSSALPYTLEMLALRRLPTFLFGLLVSASPAVAALAGAAVLGETLAAVQWLAIACIMLASAGAAMVAP